MSDPGHHMSTWPSLPVDDWTETRMPFSCGLRLLPYEAVRAAEDPDETLQAFLEDTFKAAATLAGWDPSLAVAPRAPA